MPKSPSHQWWQQQIKAAKVAAKVVGDISQYIHERLDEPDLVEDEACYCFSAPLDTCPEHGIRAKWRREHEQAK